MAKRETYPMDIAGVHRDFPLFEVRPGLRLAIVNILGDNELVLACAHALKEKLSTVDFDVIVTPETKSIPLAFALSLEAQKPYLVLRKNYKPYMGEAIQAETLSITTGQSQTLYLDEKDLPLVEQKRVLILDDVISTGSTLQAMEMILQKVGAQVAAVAAIFTEGERAKWGHIVSLGHLPLFTNNQQ